jgi:hypothetical protein
MRHIGGTSGILFSETMAVRARSCSPMRASLASKASCRSGRAASRRDILGLSGRLDRAGNGNPIRVGEDRQEGPGTDQESLRRLGCESVGFMYEYEKHELVLAFTHRGRSNQLRASAKGWAQMYLRENPWTPRLRKSRVEHEQAALRQGQIAAIRSCAILSKGRLPRLSAASCHSRPCSCPTC